MSALPMTFPTAPAVSAPTPRNRHLRVVSETDAARAAAEHEAGQRALAAAQSWSARTQAAVAAPAARPARVQPVVARTRTQEAPLVLTERGRLALRILAGVVASIVAIVVGAVIGLALRSAPVAGESVVVGSGDTLWSIAATVPGVDVRDAMADIVELNGLGGSTIQPGQVLLLPATH